MKNTWIRTVFAFGALMFVALLVTSLATSAQQETATNRIVSAANTFLSTLDQKQRQSILFSFNDEAQRKRWSNFPIMMVPRGGLSLKEMNSAQRAAAMALVASALSPRGFEKVQQIMVGDEVNKTTDQGPTPNRGAGPPPGGGGPPPMTNGGPPSGRVGIRPTFGSGAIFGKDLYYLSILGTPSEKNPWMLQFGGHHLALNITIAGDQGVLTPTLTGAQPALYTMDGKTVRPLGQESDKALALLKALDTEQRNKAILSYQLADLVLGPGQDGKTIEPEGLKATEMNERQRGMMLDVISEWAGIIHERAATARMIEIKNGLNDTWFAWSGPINAAPGHNIAAYYRIQGPNLVIEYAPQTLGGDLAMHVHTMYRDPTNDYGRKFIAK